MVKIMYTYRYKHAVPLLFIFAEYLIHCILGIGEVIKYHTLSVNNILLTSIQLKVYNSMINKEKINRI